MKSLPTKQELALKGEELVKKFCELNKLPVPQTMWLYLGDRDYEAIGTCTFYRKDTIYIAVHKCAHVGTAGSSWSYPGYVIDRTPYGVFAHELGHHVDVHLGKKLGFKQFAYSSMLSEDIMNKSGEEKLTNYCPNPAEWFAEMMRLFITNPDLLQKVRPLTYRLLRGYLTPVVKIAWEAVLFAAPDRTLLQARKKIEDARRS